MFRDGESIERNVPFGFPLYSVCMPARKMALMPVLVDSNEFQHIDAIKQVRKS